MKWPAAIKKSMSEAKPTNNEQLWKVIKEKWEKIPKKRCEDLVNSMHYPLRSC